MKTPYEIAVDTLQDSGFLKEELDMTQKVATRLTIAKAIRADRAQRSSVERFGLHVYSLMNEVDEWNADVFEDIAGIANRLGIPFDN